ncbi:ABC transporter permease [Vibrio viridaestus]|nr:ABC transporter permease [Vibrio viridaestus]
MQYVQWRQKSLLFPIIIFLCVFFVVPLSGLLLRSLTDPSFGLQNYAQLLSTPTYSDVLFNTFFISILVTVLALILSFPLAWSITLMPGKWGQMLLNVVLLSMWTSLLARTYSWLVLLQNTGAINKVLMNLGLISQPLELVHNMTGVVIGMTYIMIPFFVLPLQACMSAIDPMVLQAASICGASPKVTFFRVFLPLCKPGIFAGSLMVFVMSLGYYITPTLLGGVSDMMLPEFIIQQIQNFLNWGIASASAVLLITITLIIFYINIKVQSESPVSSDNGA